MGGLVGAFTTGAIGGIFRFFLCSFFTGLAVKIMDDWLDGSRDNARDSASRGDLRERLGSASLPYALFSFSCGVAFSPLTAIALFFASYTLGMAGRAFADRYPSGLAGWQESAVAIVVSLAACRWVLTLVACLTLAAVQGLDDLMDYRAIGPWSAPLVRRLGFVPTAVGSVALVLIALGLDFPRTLGALLGACLVWAVEAVAGTGWEPPDVV